MHVSSELVLLVHHHLVSDSVVVLCLFSIAHLDIADEPGEDEDDHEKASYALEDYKWMLCAVLLPVLVELLPLLALTSGILLLRLVLTLVVLLELLLVLALLLGLLVLVLLVCGAVPAIGLLIGLLLLLPHSLELCLLPEEFLVMLAWVPTLILVRVTLSVAIVVRCTLLVRPTSPLLEWAATPRALVILLLCPLLLLLSVRLATRLLIRSRGIVAMPLVLITQHIVSGGDLFKLLLRLSAGPIRMILHRQLVVRLLD